MHIQGYQLHMLFMMFFRNGELYLEALLKIFAFAPGLLHIHNLCI